MRLLPYWQQGTITGYIDRTKASIGTLEDEVLDLCKSPLYTIEDSAECEDKNAEFKKAATINGYKSLIKQAKPKSYLCLSRKAEKRARFNKLQLSRIHNSKMSSSKRYKLLQKRRLLLSTHQKKQMRLRRKKIMTLHQERLNKKAGNESVRIETEQEMANGGIEKLEGAHTDNVTLKPPSAAISDRKRLLAKVDQATGGYFSEPEHCSNCPTKGRKQKQKTKENSVVVPKRSKSETKQPSKRVCLHANYLINNNVNNNNLNNNNVDDHNVENNCEKVESSCCNLKTKNMHVLKEAAVEEILICKGKQNKRKPRVFTKKPSNASASKNKITDDHHNLMPSISHLDDSEKYCEHKTESDSQLGAEEHLLTKAEEQIDNIQTQTAQHSIDNQQFMQPILPPLRIACHQHHNVATKRSRSRTKFGVRKRTKQKHSTIAYALDETLPAATRGDVVPKWNNGWKWEGEPFQGAVFLNSDDPLVIRTCYPAMRHKEGDVIRTRDCVLLKANEDNELPYVAKVAHLWKNPEDGEMMMSLLWYYRPEHTEQGRQPNDSTDEVLASRHRDHNSVACIEDKCYVLTFSEYCRYRRRLRALEEEIEDVTIVPKRACGYSIRTVPENTNPELVMFCRRAYEFRTKRLLKMPSKQDYYVVTS